MTSTGLSLIRWAALSCSSLRERMVCCAVRIPRSRIWTKLGPWNIVASLLHLAHHLKIACHLERAQIFSHIHHTYFWPFIEAEITFTFRSFPHCTLTVSVSCVVVNRFVLPVNPSLIFISIDIFGLLPKTKEAAATSSRWLIASPNWPKSSNWFQKQVSKLLNC